MTDDLGRPGPADDEELADFLDLDAADVDNAPEPAAAPAVDQDEADPAAFAESPPATATDDGAAPTPAVATRSSRHRASKRNKPRRKAPWWELPALVGLAIVIAILVKSFLVQPFYIPSQSMEQTLHGCPGCSGDRILVSKIIYDFRDPHPGDIVVFNAPTGWNDEAPSIPPSNPILRTIRGFGQLVGFVPPDGLVLVKRVIATGGQTVKGDADNNVFVSNHGAAGPWRQLHEPFVYESGGTDLRAKFGPITVPKGRLWVMGDHRDESADSRYHCGPDGADGPFNSSCDAMSATVPISNVIGKAFVIAWPPSRWRTLGTPTTFTTAAAGISGAGIAPIGVVLPVFLVRRRKRR